MDTNQPMDTKTMIGWAVTFAVGYVAGALLLHAVLSAFKKVS